MCAKCKVHFNIFASKLQLYANILMSVLRPYSVAQHLFILQTSQEVDIHFLVPSLQNFAVSAKADDVPIFTLEFHSVIPAGNPNELLTRFEWDGAVCAIYNTHNGYEVQICPAGEARFYRMLTDKEFTHGIAEIGTVRLSSCSFLANNFLMMMYAFATAPYDTLMFHASVIRHDENGYLFLGKSGTGKSTHSRLWLAHIPGSELLNDDNPIVRIFPNGEVWVYGSPWSGKTPCYRNESVQAKAIVRLTQAPYNRMEEKKGAQAFASLLPSCSCLKQSQRLYNAVCDTVGRLAVAAPVYELACLPDAEAVELCYTTVHQK